MKKSLLFGVLFLVLTVTAVQAEEKKSNELQKKSELVELYGNYPGGTSYPLPFNELNQAHTNPAPSTGYYYYDNTEAPLKKMNDIWFPEVKFNTNTDHEPVLWTRILAGPRIVAESYWANSLKGKYFFRNPADMLDDDIYDRQGGAIDTTSNAIAGPMPIGINGGFYFNGLRYDSFYVSQTGIIALTNRRYIYDETNNQRIVPDGQDNCYDVYSQDWFAGGLRSRENGDGLNDETADDFGYTCSVLGRNPNVNYPNPVSDPFFNYTAGLRSFRNGDISDITGAGWSSESCKPALIAPFWGNVNLSQYDAKYSKPEDYGKVYFKTTSKEDKLIIAFENVSLYGRIFNLPDGDYNIEKDSRPGVPGYVELDAKVILDKIDSSITFVYERLHKDDINIEAQSEYDAGDVLRANTTAGVFGWARTTNYDTKNPNSKVKPGDKNYPWHSEYKQYTHYFSRNKHTDNKYPREETVVKFKQWKNTLRAVNMVFKIRNSEQEGPDYDYDFMDEPINGTDYELLAGSPLIGAIQPVGVVQNLTNDIQGPKGVNFTPQDLEFRTKLEVTNIITGRRCKSVEVPVKADCLKLDGDWEDCNGNATDRVRLAKTISYDDDLGYNVDEVYKGYEFTDAGFTGIPSYDFAEVTFSHFEANELIESHIGRMNCRLVVVPRTPMPQNKSIGDQWPFDDTLRKRFYVMRRIRSMNDDVTEYHVESTTGWAVPSVLKWVAKDAYVVDGDVVSVHALPPRGAFTETSLSNTVPENPVVLNSPVIELNRTRRVMGLDIEAEPTKLGEYDVEFGKGKDLGGDELSSFPIELAFVEEGDTIYCYNTFISFSVQRGRRLNPGYLQNYSRFVGENCFLGPEAKIYLNNTHSTGFSAGGSRGNKDEAADMLVLEYAKPSDDGLNGICNIPEENWRHLPQRRGSDKEAAEDMSVLTLYGGGGYLRGFLKEDPDSVLAYPTDTEFNAMDINDYYGYFLFDEGLDLDYKKYVVQVPDTFIRWQNLGANNFRFRFKVLAHDHSQTLQIPDDYDDFYIDNINVIFDQDTIDTQRGIAEADREVINPLDIECTSVRLDWPYTVIPPTQATSLPIIVKIANNSDQPAPSFSVRVRVFREEDFDKESMNPVKGGKPLYCREEILSNFLAGEELEVRMPAWNARKSQRDLLSKYVLVANVLQDKSDFLPSNDTTFYDAEIRFGDVFAYDPVEDFVGWSGIPGEGMDTLHFPSSDVDQEIGLNLPGRGLNLKGHSYERGTGYPPLTYEDRVGDGITTNVSSGKFAVKFELANTDSIKGFQAYFTTLNSSNNFIEFEVVKEGPTVPSQKVVAGTKLNARRATDPVTGKLKLEEYITYELPEPIELAAGTYWITILQMETDGLNLGATSARSGMKVTNFYEHPNNKIWAQSGSSVYMDKNFRFKYNGFYANRSLFAYVNANYSSAWQQFSPTTGPIGYAHTNHEGLSLKDHVTKTFMNGSWLPLLRPYFGPRSYGEEIGKHGEYELCPEDTTPVELTSFEAKSRKGAIQLSWATASETNNGGFEILRRLNGSTEWGVLAFVRGNGTTKSNSYYNYDDKDVKVGQTYQYQLRQLDNDGTAGCGTSNIVTVKYELLGDLYLAQNTPNPFTNATSITYTIPADENVKLEVIDMFGNVVNVLENSYKVAGTYTAVWFGDDEQSRAVASGNYIYRLTVGDEVRTAKMSLIK